MIATPPSISHKPRSGNAIDENSIEISTRTLMINFLVELDSVRIETLNVGISY